MQHTRVAVLVHPRKQASMALPLSRAPIGECVKAKIGPSLSEKGVSMGPGPWPSVNINFTHHPGCLPRILTWQLHRAVAHANCATATDEPHYSAPLDSRDVGQVYLPPQPQRLLTILPIFDCQSHTFPPHNKISIYVNPLLLIQDCVTASLAVMQATQGHQSGRTG
jgi:hypothetical protein